MTPLGAALARQWTRLGARFLPLADEVLPDLPPGRLLRLSLFQVSVGLAVVLMIGTLNRVMIVELGVPAWLVASMISLPLLVAPFRALVGFRSDTHRSVLGWRRVPYLWIGTLLQFGGLAIMPFALILLSGDTNGPLWIGEAGAALAFLLLGAGLHTTQTVGLALATDLTPARSHPHVVALLSGMLLAGMIASAVVFGLVLRQFSEVRLIQVIQGTALATLALNTVALWKQEARNPGATAAARRRGDFASSWRRYNAGRFVTRRLVAVALGTAGFSMGDVLLEPYGGRVLHLAVGTTTALTALLAVGGLGGFAAAAFALRRGADPWRAAASGALAGLAGFAAVIFAAPLGTAVLFGIGTGLIGFGAGLFAVGTLVATMAGAEAGQSGLALGAWGAAQATAVGLAMATGGIVCDLVGNLAASGAFGEGLDAPAAGYGVVYHIEIALLFAALVAMGPLVRRQRPEASPGDRRSSFAEPRGLWPDTSR